MIPSSHLAMRVEVIESTIALAGRGHKEIRAPRISTSMSYSVPCPIRFRVSEEHPLSHGHGPRAAGAESWCGACDDCFLTNS